MSYRKNFVKVTGLKEKPLLFLCLCIGFSLREIMKEEERDELDYKTLLTNVEKLEATGMTETKKMALYLPYA